MDKEREKLKRAAAYKKRVAKEQALEKRIAREAIAKHRANMLVKKVKKDEDAKTLRERIKVNQQETTSGGGIAEALRTALKRKQEEQV